MRFVILCIFETSRTKLMEIFSLSFLSFVIVGLLIHEIVGHLKPKYQWIVRLIVSSAFYIYVAKLRILYILFSAVSVWLGAYFLSKITMTGKTLRKAEGLTKDDKKAIKAATNKKKRLVVFIVIAFNLAILATIKYILPVMSKSFVLPLGISFYTFQAIAYTVDVYGEKYESQNNFAKLLLYLLWFPQLIQGPINRYDLIEKDLYECSSLKWNETREALLLFLFGAIKRYVVGDALAPYVNSILGASSGDYPGSYLLFGAFLFAIEQYANFSGGIDMVMGISCAYGVKLNDNFKQPYFSKTLAEFWRRWHISLGAFMRDYVFYPFAMSKTIQKFTKKVSDRFGNHLGRAVTGGIGNIIVFALVGIWHGPQLHYLAWGLYNGIIIALSDALAPAFLKCKNRLHIADDNKAFTLFQMFRTFMIIVFAGYFDVIDSVKLGIRCFINTFLHFNASEFGIYISNLYAELGSSYKTIIVAVIGIIVMLTWSMLKENGKNPPSMILTSNIIVRWIICYALIFLFLYAFSVVGASGGFMYAAF